MTVEETEGQEAGRLYGPEADAFDEALNSTAVQYVKTYNLEPEKSKGQMFTELEFLVNDIANSRKELNDLEKEFLTNWFLFLHDEYTSR